jgi:hypothetical protein
MEQNNSDSLFELQVDHESRNYFKEAAKWTNFIAIIFFVCFGLLLLVALFSGSILMNASELPAGYEEYQATTTGLVALQMVLLIALLICLIYGGMMLLRFSSACRRGVETQDQQSFNSGLKALRNYFILMGSLAILSILGDVLNIIQSLG